MCAWLKSNTTQFFFLSVLFHWISFILCVPVYFSAVASDTRRAEVDSFKCGCVEFSFYSIKSIGHSIASFSIQQQVNRFDRPIMSLCDMSIRRRSHCLWLYRSQRTHNFLYLRFPTKTKINNKQFSVCSIAWISWSEDDNDVAFERFNQFSQTIAQLIAVFDGFDFFLRMPYAEPLSDCVSVYIQSSAQLQTAQTI